VGEVDLLLHDLIRTEAALRSLAALAAAATSTIFGRHFLDLDVLLVGRRRSLALRSLGRHAAAQ